MDEKQGALYVPPIQSYKPKQYKPLDKKDIVFVLFYLISTFIVVDFGLFNSFCTGFTISYILFFVITTLYIYRKENKASLFSWLCGALSVAGSLNFALFDNSLISVFMIVLMGGLFSIYCIGISRGPSGNSGSFKMLIDALNSVFVAPFSNFGDISGSARASAKEYKKLFSSVIGFVVALPVLCVIIPLLVKSDAAFEGLVMGIIKNIGMYLLEIAIAVILLAYVYPFAFAHRHSSARDKGCSKIKKTLPVSACTSFLGAIAAIYVVYLFSQLAYFFSAFKGILPDNYTHTASAFARRGFYEMFAICVINIAIVSIVSMLIKKRAIVIKLLSTFISLFSVLLIIIAMEKMKMNISIFGLSNNRVLVCVFMLMVLFVNVFFIVHIFAPKVPYIKPIIIFCSVLFIAMSFADVDNQVAKYNVKAYSSGVIDTLDVEHLGNLSASSVPEIIKLCSSDDDKASAAAKRAVVNKLIYDYNEAFSISVKDGKMSYSDKVDFRSYNRAKRIACKSINEYFNSLNDEEKKYFLTYYEYATEGYYEEDEDAYYFYNGTDDYKCLYDEQTGAYTIKEKVQL